MEKEEKIQMERAEEHLCHGRSRSVKNCKSLGFTAADKRPVPNDYMI